MGFKFKPGDMIVKIGSNAKANDVYIIESTGRHKNTNYTEGMDIYKVTIPNSINGHNNIVDKSSRYIHKNYRLASNTEKILYGRD